MTSDNKKALAIILGVGLLVYIILADASIAVIAMNTPKK